MILLLIAGIIGGSAGYRIWSRSKDRKKEDAGMPATEQITGHDPKIQTDGTADAEETQVTTQTQASQKSEEATHSSTTEQSKENDTTQTTGNKVQATTQAATTAKKSKKSSTKKQDNLDGFIQ